ncbi:MAG TPA: MBL fold metallo-hydrolase [Bacteroidales bacterium]|nr:MBL fold metallo-hydrolase [Bacteroidales bacterium]
MNPIIFLLPVLLLFQTGSYHQPCLNKNKAVMEASQDFNQVLNFARSIQWLGQATVKISYKGSTIYIDPYKLKLPDKADLILITHDHSDHLSLSDIAKIAGKDTRFIVARACLDKLKKEGYQHVEAVAPGETVTAAGLVIKVVPAYNRVKNAHPKSSRYVGFVMDFGGVVLYHTGDTERIPEMKDIKCDIIMLPLGQTYTMTSVEEAVEAVLDTRARIAIPIHWGMYEGSKNDAVKFEELLKKRNITVLPGR